MKFDAVALNLAKAKGWSESERHEMWSAMYQQSADRQREFTGGEDSYVAFMEACFNGTGKVHG